MVVFDTGWRALRLNPAAEAILGVPAAGARGKTWAELLPGRPDPGQCLGPGALPVEVGLGDSDASSRAGAVSRRYTLALTPLPDHRAVRMGCLLLLHDVTEQQRALAMLHEREHLARELHDGIGQVLGFASLKTGATRKLMADERPARADEQLAHLEGIMADAHSDVREYILNLRSAPSEDLPFFAALERYVTGFRQNHDLRVDLSVDAGGGDDLLVPEAQMQLLRIVQEAFSNVCKHAGADCVRVSFDRGDGLVRVRIQDNGQGFDPERAGGAEGSHFELLFLRERAEQVGGTLRVDTAPGEGTCVTVEVARRLSVSPMMPEMDGFEVLARLTTAAAAVEAGEFTVYSLDSVATLTDALGQLGRVFQRMAREVKAREQSLKRQVQELRIQIDESKKACEAAEITETEYFRDLCAKEQRLRQRSRE